METGDYSGDVSSKQGPSRKNSNLGGQNPAFHSSVCIDALSNVTSKKNLLKTLTQPETCKVKNRYKEPVVVHHVLFHWHAKGILSTFVSTVCRLQKSELFQRQS